MEYVTKDNTIVAHHLNQMTYFLSAPEDAVLLLSGLLSLPEEDRKFYFESNGVFEISDRAILLGIAKQAEKLQYKFNFP